MPRIITRILAALASLVGALALAAPAGAHTALVASTPEDGATVTELAEVSLEFTEQLLDIGNELAIVAPDGTRTALEIEDPVTQTVTAAVPDDALVAGDNTLAFRVVASDGHPIEGEIAFTYAPEEPVASPSASASASPSASASASPSATATASAGAGPVATASPSPHVTVYEEVGPNPAIYVIIGVVAAAGLAFAIASRTRREG
ncbi:copper resistance CopC family protein [Demequina iriomotensis]|uniref:copper resistance CopC family protein n=1 Tax=Demequina iriomotensis TaxID=1536641 RepID=UPI000783D681|nr:copper resistance CopC family protein [Demequina iriomotensis]